MVGTTIARYVTVKRTIVAVAVLACVSFASSARADVNCQASVNRTTVPNGGEIVLTVVARGDIGWNPEFQVPQIGGVRIAGGSTSQSMSVINGVSEMSVTRTYYLTVSTTVDFVIEPISVVSKRGRCATDPIAIEVTDARQAPVASSPSSPATTSPVSGLPRDDLFVTLDADQTDVWIGQQIVLTFRYWRRIQPWSNPSYVQPRTEGFWREDLGSEQNYRQVIGGRAYNVTEIRYAIFPTRTGELVVEPAELRFPRGAFDSFFQTRPGRRGPRALRTDPVIIQVKALPSPRPKNFSGIVASTLALVGEVDRKSVPRGEALGLKISLVADGFLKGFSGLVVREPATTKLHDAGESYQAGREQDRLVGRIGVEKVVVPEVEGILELPPVALVWFDTRAGEYRTAQTDNWEVAVTPSDLPQAGSEESGFLRNEISRLGDDLAFIHPVPRRLAHHRRVVTGSVLWWVALLFPGILLGAFRGYLRFFGAQRRSPAWRRRQAALAVAQGHLTQTDRDDYDCVVRAIGGYVADMQDRPLASISPEDVLHYCQTIGMMSAGQRLTEIMNESDAARYGGAKLAPDAAVLAETGSILASIYKKTRKSSGSKTAPLLLFAVFAINVGLAGTLAAEIDTQAVDPARLLAEGNQAYTEGRLTDAAEAYLRVRDAGVDEATVHFNLGNTYARLGQLGRAVACYLRAERLAPRDQDVRENLAWVRSHIRDLELNEQRLPPLVSQLAALVHVLTLDQWAWILVVLVWTLAGLVGWVGITRNSQRISGVQFW